MSVIGSQNYGQSLSVTLTLEQADQFIRRGVYIVNPGEGFENERLTDGKKISETSAAEIIEIIKDPNILYAYDLYMYEEDEEDSFDEYGNREKEDYWLEYEIPTIYKIKRKNGDLREFLSEIDDM